MPVYTAESSIRRPKHVLREMWVGVRESRYIAWRLFVKDLKSEYSRSVFGVVWDFVDPLVLALIFYALWLVGIIRVTNLAIPYPLFIVFGFLLYQTFVEAVLMPMFIQERSRALMAHVKLRPESMILAVIYRLLFNHGIRVMILLGFAMFLLRPAWLGGSAAGPHFSVVGFLTFIACSPLLILAGMSVGLVLAPFHMIYGDVGRGTQIILNPLRYASPVMYQIPNLTWQFWLMTLNPIAAILDSLRSVATVGQFTWMPQMGAWVGIQLAVFLVGWFIYHLAVPVVGQRY
ncbi:ABC transporter permease [bacterium]|nr:ABC transporter permease [bacterium]